MSVPDNFLGLDSLHSSFAESNVLVLPIPFESTVSYGGGTEAGPSAIIAASQQVELYDREFDSEPALNYRVHTLAPLDVERLEPEVAMQVIKDAVQSFASEHGAKLLCILGGEHSISGAVAAGLAPVHPEFVTVQIDAHADLRDEYEGTPHSHACAARRILDVAAGPVMQLGIRSLSVDEAELIRADDRVTTLWAEDVHAGQHVQPLAEFVRGKSVYLTIDIDGLDATIMPSTGTPEPNGLTWVQVLEIIRVVARESAKVIAFDVVELAPIAGLHAPDFVTAKLVYKTMNIILAAQAQTS